MAKSETYTIANEEWKTIEFEYLVPEIIRSKNDLFKVYTYIISGESYFDDMLIEKLTPISLK